jgi:hypothetical protein
MEPALSVYRGFWHSPASPAWSFSGAGFGALALSCAVTVSAGFALAQGMSEQQIRCLQLQQELAAAQGGGGANRDELMRIEQQIAQADRVFQGTRASMEDAGCFESFFIFGRGLVRSPKCLNMNNRLEDSRRELAQLQQQRKVLTGGGGNRRRQAELQQALARSGCGGVAPQPARRGGGLFDFFRGGREDDMEQLPQTPIYRSIDPNGRYRSVCVRLCDGFYYPVSYITYGTRLAQDAERCQSTCAAPAELYVYRNPGQDIEQAVSLSGSAYMDLPVALRYKQEYVKGCSCKQAEYNPTEIEAANKRAEADPEAQPDEAATAAQPGEATAATPAPQEPPAQMATPADAPQFDLDITGSNQPAPPPQAATEAAPPAAVPEEQQPPPPPAAAEAPPAPPPPPPTAQAAPPPPPPAPAATPEPAQSTVIKRKPAAQPASPFAPHF